MLWMVSSEDAELYCALLHTFCRWNDKIQWLDLCWKERRSKAGNFRGVLHTVFKRWEMGRSGGQGEEYSTSSIRQSDRHNYIHIKQKQDCPIVYGWFFLFFFFFFFFHVPVKGTVNKSSISDPIRSHQTYIPVYTKPAAMPPPFFAQLNILPARRWPPTGVFLYNSLGPSRPSSRRNRQAVSYKFDGSGVAAFCT